MAVRGYVFGSLSGQQVSVFTPSASCADDEVFVAVQDSENTNEPYIDAVKTASKFLNRRRVKGYNPYLHIEIDNLVLHADEIYTRVRWPTPAFFWRAIDRHKAMTSAELVTNTHNDYAVLRDAMGRWLDDAKKVHLVMTEERRDDLQDLVGAVLPLLSEVGASDADRELIYRDAALCLWMSVQRNLPLDDARKRSLDRVLSLLDDTLVSPGG